MLLPAMHHHEGLFYIGTHRSYCIFNATKTDCLHFLLHKQDTALGELLN